MTLRFAVLAEYANVTGDGKLNILGVTERLFAFRFPAVHRDLYIVNCLESDNDDDGTTQEISIHIVDPDGGTIAEIRGQLAIEGGKQAYNQIHVFQDLQFAQPGSCQVEVAFNGKVVSVLPLELIAVPEPPPPPSLN